MLARYLPLLFSWSRQLGYGVFLTIAVVGGVFFFWQKAREEHFELIESVDALIMASIGGLIGARLGYVLLHLGEFRHSVFSLIQFNEYPGLWSVSGLIAMLVILYRSALKQKQDPWEMWDFAGLFMSWYFAFYWLALFFVGAAAGTSTNLPWGIVFPQRVDAAHPVQLYAAAAFFVLFAYLSWAEPRYRFFFWYRSKKRTAKTGFLICMYLIASGLIGFLLGFVQYPFLLVLDIDLHQVAQALIFVVGCVLLFLRSGRSFFLVRENKPLRSQHETPESTTA